MARIESDWMFTDMDSCLTSVTDFTRAHVQAVPIGNTGVTYTKQLEALRCLTLSFA